MDSHSRILELDHCRRLFLKNYEVPMNIGVHDFEKKGAQRVIINIDLYVLLPDNTPKQDDLSCLNHCTPSLTGQWTIWRRYNMAAIRPFFGPVQVGSGRGETESGSYPK